MTLYPRIYFACHTRHVRDEKAGRTLSSHQASILDHLDEIEPTGLFELAKHMGVTPSTMSISIDRLSRDGYVVRGPDPRDGRRVCLRLTAEGVRIKSAKSVLDPERVEAMLGRLNPEERREALKGLELLARASSEQMASLSRAPRGIAERRIPK
jgi:DNA-binding MarR family transcriptional regulator